MQKTLPFLNLYLNRFLGDFVPVIPIIGLLFLDRNFNLGDISLFFLCLSLTVLLVELPAGLLADAKNPRLVIILSRLFKLAAFVTLFYAGHIAVVCLAAVFWGIASALDSGAIQSYTFQLARERGLSDEFEAIYSRTFTASLLGLLTAGLVASQISWLGFVVLQQIGISVLFLCALSAVFLPQLPKTAQAVGEEIKPSGWPALLSLKKLSPALLTLLSIGVLAGGIKGSLDEYTTILLADKGLTIGVIGYIIFGLEVLRTTGAAVAAKFILNIRQQIFVLALLGASFLAVALGNVFVAVGALVLILFIDAVLWVHNDATIQRNTNDSSRATIASLKNFGTEVLAGAVFLMTWLLGASWPVYYLYLSGGVVLLLSAVLLTSRNKNII